jgi:hypothetical protein
MFDFTTLAPEAPKPAAPRTWREPYIAAPVFCYALRGPAGWHVAMVEKEPLPHAYVLTIWKAGARRTALLYQDAFFTGHGQLWDGDRLCCDFRELLSSVIKGTTGSTEDWSLRNRPLTDDEFIDLDVEGELRNIGGEWCSPLL